MEGKLISIIIPVFNMESYIERCISCIEKQTYKKLEVIFVDDGSSDSSYEILEEYRKKYNYINVIHTKNRGASAARNTGVQTAKGDYIVYVDADDYFYEDYIEYLYNIAAKYNADIAISDYIKTANTNTKEKQSHRKAVVKRYDVIAALENMSYRKEIGASPVGKIIKTSIAKQCYFDEDVAYYEDYLYCCMVINNCKKIFFGNQPKYLYIQNPQSSTHQYDYQKCIKSWTILKCEIEKEAERHPEIKNAYVSKMLAISLDMLKRIYGQNQNEKEIRAYIKSNCKIVFNDKKCKTLKRLLALSAWVNISVTVVVGKALLRILSRCGKEL